MDGVPMDVKVPPTHCLLFQAHITLVHSPLGSFCKPSLGCFIFHDTVDIVHVKFFLL